MTWPIVELTFWSPGDPRSEAVDRLLADPTTPLAKHGLTGIAEVYARETGAELHDVHRQWASHVNAKALAVDGALTEVVPALSNAGVPFFVAKGPAIAYVDYPDPRMRPYTDLDVYVPQKHWPDARDVIERLSYQAVPHVKGVLGGLASEFHGGTFGAVVELHAHPIDNLHRRHLPSIEAFLPHITCREVAGVETPVLDAGAHTAIQLHHLAAGHRYAKLVLYRDIDLAGASRGRALLPSALASPPYLAIVVGVLHAFGRESGNMESRGTVHDRLMRTMLSTDPLFWDEYRASWANLLALLHQQRWATAARCAAEATISFAPRRRRRRVNLQMGRASLAQTSVSKDVTTR